MPAVAGRRAERGDEGRVRGPGRRRRRSATAGPRAWPAPQQHVVALVRGDRPDAQQLAARSACPGAGSARVDARLRRRARGRRRQGVRVEQPAPGPRAGRDDRRAAASTARSRARDGHVVARRPPPSGMCTSTTSRSRPTVGPAPPGPPRRSARRRSTSAPSGIACERSRQRGARRRVRPRPGAGHGVLVHRPPERGSPSQTRRS